MPQSISLLLWQNEVEAACQLRGHKRVVEDSLSGASASRNALIWLFGSRLRWPLLARQNFSDGKQKRKGQEGKETERSHPEDGKASRCFKEHATEHRRSRTCASGLLRLSDTWGGIKGGRGRRVGRRAAWGHVMWVTRPNDILWIRCPEVLHIQTFPWICYLQSFIFSSSALELLVKKLTLTWTLARQGMLANVQDGFVRFCFVFFPLLPADICTFLHLTIAQVNWLTKLF